MTEELRRERLTCLAEVRQAAIEREILCIHSLGGRRAEEATNRLASALAACGDFSDEGRRAEVRGRQLARWVHALLDRPAEIGDEAGG